MNISYAQALQSPVCWGQQGRKGALPLQAALFWAGPESQVGPIPLEQSAHRADANISTAPVGLGVTHPAAEPWAKPQRCQQHYLHCLQRENQHISHPGNTEILFSIIWKSS